MKFFTYDLIAAANDWTPQSPRAFKSATQRMERAARSYDRQLKRLRPKISKAAWKFFMHGKQEESLHDAFLLSIELDEGLPRNRTGLRNAWRQKKHTRAHVEFASYNGDFVCRFDVSNVYRFHSTLFAEDYRRMERG